MQGITDFFNQGWVGSLIGAIGIVVGIVIATWFYLISKKIAKPSYQYSSLQLIGKEENNLPKEVSVTYNGTTVSRLTKTKLVFWNDGTETIHGSAIVSDDPILIEYPKNTNILGFNIIKCTREFNKFRLIPIEEHSNLLMIDFDYLDPKDGVVVELIHDSEQRYPKITGTIKGIPVAFTNLGRTYEFTRTTLTRENSRSLILTISRVINAKNRKLPAWIMLLTGIYLMSFFFIQDVSKKIEPLIFIYDECKNKSLHEHLHNFSLSIVLPLIGVLYSGTAAFILFGRRRKFPKELEITIE